MTSRILTPANQITLLRLAFIPTFAILEVQQSYGWALTVLAAAILSDFADGILARILHQESEVGIALDPIADKLLMATAFLLLAFRGVLPWWITILVLSRDVVVIVTTLVISLVAGYRPFRPSLLGKGSTFFQMATIFVAVNAQAHVSSVNDAIVRVAIYLTLGFTVASGIHYLLTLPQRAGQRSSDEAAPATSESAKRE
ncbi:MAG: CDP-alcohol phosphatidyltransferase family protein [Terriglobia bacterium]|jgi:cardiolipin synthase